MHYHRKYRHGSVNFTTREIDAGIRQVRAYKTIPARHHPLAQKSGRAYEHRVVLYDSLGPGEHECHWCQRPIHWANQGDPDALIPDHLNGIEDDNRIENLVPSCIGCNTGRSSQARSLILRERGAWSGNDTIAHLRRPSRRETIDPEYRALQTG
tara:strand:+ start:124 stop:585 length:462 start_codon:yes stop_codon:yes gene_type:complete